MIPILLSLLASWPVTVGEALLRAWHSYDLLRCDVVATPEPAGLRVACTLTLRVTREGPLRFLLSSGVSGLRTSRSGEPLRCQLDGTGLSRLVRIAAPAATDIPGLLTLAPEPPPHPGQTVEILVEYLWHPSGDGFAYATAPGIDTHLSGFWLPTMADELFDASVEWRGEGSFATLPRATGDGRFESVAPVPVVALIAGEFEAHRRGGFALLLPPACEADPEALLDDLEAVTTRLTARFGPCTEGPFTLVVSPRLRPVPSYCGGSFAVVHASMLPGAAGRLRWIDHLAHECSHRWWGHAVPMPVLGGGGTWLREGLAQWSGIAVAGEMFGVEDQLYRAHVRAYLGRVDLRRAPGGERFLFANEATLLDATDLDDPSVSYLRGVLVHRLLAALAGRERFLSVLRSWQHGVHRSAHDLADALGLSAVVAYYAGTTRLPDFVLSEVATGPGFARAVVRCEDRRLPALSLPCLVEAEGGALVWVEMRDGRGELSWTGTGTPRRIEIDPERLLLDPIRSNGFWER